MIVIKPFQLTDTLVIPFDWGSELRSTLCLRRSAAPPQDDAVEAVKFAVFIEDDKINRRPR